MIIFKNLPQKVPYLMLKEKYDKSINAGQNDIEAICIASYSTEFKEVNARYVNLKIIDGNDFIFFTNYNSLKANDFSCHPQITSLIYWDKLNIQIRIKASIKRTSNEFNKKYFKKRDIYKNALSISSNQSSKIKSYEEVNKNYLDTLKMKNLDECPKYWGGFAFTPYYFEFWEGHESRINKREVFEFKDSDWNKYILEP
jgi:pyridoxamine 5'-phosphate oxidase